MIRSRISREKAHSIHIMFNINEPPVNLDKICEGLSFKIAYTELPESVSAAIKVVNDKKAIIVNSKHSKTRQRFSIAHELGHYLSGHESFDNEKRVFIDADRKYLNDQFRQEEEANEFAAELLMPESLLRKDVTSNEYTLNQLAQRYQVSEQAMTIQLVNLQLPIKN